MIRETYGPNEVRIQVCSLIYLVCGGVAAVPGIGGTVGGAIMLSTPRLWSDSGFPTFLLEVLGVGIAFLLISAAYFFTAIGLWRLSSSAAGFGFALVIPVLFFVPTGSWAGWLVLSALTSDGSNIVMTREYRAIRRTTMLPAMRPPWALIASQVSVVVQIIATVVALS
ncbi:MAG: hypothetical protein MUF23_14165 [Pirellula sp.]|nr:hypothetical protein [Pirellula sp.]